MMIYCLGVKILRKRRSRARVRKEGMHLTLEILAPVNRQASEGCDDADHANPRLLLRPHDADDGRDDGESELCPESAPGSHEWFVLRGLSRAA
eukprot:10153659-Alexandrium_andersonii.AAC.1